MIISSPSFSHNQIIPAKFTCDGHNVNPRLEFSNLPKQARSLALIVDDPDAPGATWVHWTIWNIDPATPGIEENSTPPGSVEGITSFGPAGWGGPCPPKGRHRYFFKLYALDIKLNLTSSAKPQELMDSIAHHIIAQAQLIGRYERTINP